MKQTFIGNRAVDCRLVEGISGQGISGTGCLRQVTFGGMTGGAVVARAVWLSGLLFPLLLFPLPATGQSTPSRPGTSPPVLGRDRDRGAAGAESGTAPGTRPGSSSPGPSSSGPSPSSGPAEGASASHRSGESAGSSAGNGRRGAGSGPARKGKTRSRRAPGEVPGKADVSSARPAVAPRDPVVASPSAPRGPEVLVTSESITHRIRMAPNGVVVVEFPLADAIYAIHPGNQNIIEVDIDRDSKPNDPLVFRPGASFDPLLRTQTVHSLQFVSGLFVTLIFEPTSRIEENDHRVILQYDIASIRAARARKGLATNLLRRPVSPLMDEDPRLQPMPSVVPLATSTSLEPVSSAGGTGSPANSSGTSRSQPGGPASDLPRETVPPAPSLPPASVTSPPPASTGSAGRPSMAGGTKPGSGDTGTGISPSGLPPLLPPAVTPSPSVTSPSEASPSQSAAASASPGLPPVFRSPDSRKADTGETRPEPRPAPPVAVPPPATAPATPNPGGDRLPAGRNIALSGTETPLRGVISGETGTLVLPATPAETPSPSRSRRGADTDASGSGLVETPLRQLDERPTPQMQLSAPPRAIRGEPGLPSGADGSTTPRRNMTAAEREKYRLITEYYQTLGISVATVHRLQLDLEERIAGHRQRRSVDWLASLDQRAAQKNFPRWPVMVAFVEIVDDSDFPGIRRYILSITVHEKAPRPLYINSLDPDVFIITRNERVIVNTERLIPLVTLAGNSSTVVRPGETAYFGVAIPRPTLSDNQMLEIAFIDAEKANRPILAREFRMKK